MIDVFETWFNQFSKEEQAKLLIHIKMRHFNKDNKTKELLSKEVKKIHSSMSSSRKREKQIV